MRAISILLLGGFLGACGNGAADPAADEDGGPAAVSGMMDADADTAVAAETDAVSGESAEPQGTAAIAEAEPASGNASTGTTVDRLPLQLGFYISEDYSCAEASNATLQLLTREGINTSRVPCEFDAIERVGPNTYRVTETCTEGGAAWGGEEHVSTDTTTYEILSETRFRQVGDGWERVSNHCPQSTLPDPWRNNDIDS